MEQITSGMEAMEPITSGMEVTPKEMAVEMDHNFLQCLVDAMEGNIHSTMTVSVFKEEKKMSIICWSQAREVGALQLRNVDTGVLEKDFTVSFYTPETTGSNVGARQEKWELGNNEGM